MAGEEEEGALAARASWFADFPRSEIVGRGRTDGAAEVDGGLQHGGGGGRRASKIRGCGALLEARVRVTNTEEDDRRLDYSLFLVVLDGAAVLRD